MVGGLREAKVGRPVVLAPKPMDKVEWAEVSRAIPGSGKLTMSWDYNKKLSRFKIRVVSVNLPS